jgi:RNA polymerase sigma factor (sigma-70 family)
MRRISRIPLLTREREIELGREIAHCRERRRLGVIERACERRGETAIWELVRSNLRLNAAFAFRYRRQTTLSVLDLMQEGTFGLRTAAERFDPERGFRFTTYAGWWILRAMERGSGNFSRNGVRDPANATDDRITIARTQQELRQKLTREPTRHEVAAWLRWSPHKVDDILEHARGILPLDSPFGDDGDLLVGDVIPDARVPDAEWIAILDSFVDRLTSALDDLPEKQRDVLERRFGLLDDETPSLEEIGEVYELSRERIRQIQEQALRKLRSTFEPGETLDG